MPLEASNLLLRPFDTPEVEYLRYEYYQGCYFLQRLADNKVLYCENGRFFSHSSYAGWLNKLKGVPVPSSAWPDESKILTS